VFTSGVQGGVGRGASRGERQWKKVFSGYGYDGL
jgi:hypothetical protein